MAEAGSWPSIRRNGLLSTTALLDRFQIIGRERVAIESRRRTNAIEIRHPSLRFSRFGGPEVLEIVDLPDPHPGPGQVRIAVRAASVNASDWESGKG